MKMLKKMIKNTISISLIGALLSISSIVTANASYIKGDTNGNGTISSADIVDLMLFLNGSRYADGNHVERLDVNRDYIIDKEDLSMLYSIWSESLPTDYIESENNEDLPPYEGRDYVIFDPITGEEIDEYSLPSLSVNSFSLDNETRGIIPPIDDREHEDSLKSVLRVQNNEGYGTAFIIDNHLILTAAHVLYNNDDSPHLIQNQNFNIYDNYNTSTNDIITPISFHIPKRYIYNSTNPNEERWRYDYALVKVAEDLTDYVGDIEFSLGVMRNGYNGLINTRKLYITGFGGNVNDDYINPSNADVKTTGYGYLLPLRPYNDIYYNPLYWNYAIYSSVDAVSGDSGAPLYVYDSQHKKVVIGIYNYSGGTQFNQSARITPNILQFIYNNDNI